MNSDQNINFDLYIFYIDAHISKYVLLFEIITKILNHTLKYYFIVSNLILTALNN